MSLMDHSEALRLQAAERYVLGELSPELREQYEEHYFTCEECASDVKASGGICRRGPRAIRERKPHNRIVREGRPIPAEAFTSLAPLFTRKSSAPRTVRGVPAKLRGHTSPQPGGAKPQNGP